MKNEKLSKTNFMRNKRAFILTTVMCMGIGFAFLSSNLTITGNTNVSGNKWSIYFNKVDITVQGDISFIAVFTFTY